jgi:hypothetical protein
LKFPAKNSVDFTPVPAGNHLAVCNAVVDLGLQKGSEMYPDPRRQVYIRFELPNERLTFTRDGEQVEGPMVIGRIMTASMSKKANLRSFVENFFAKKFSSDDAASDFDLAKLVGRHCMLTVTHTDRADGRTFANIAGVAPLPKGMEKQTRGMENEPLIFDLAKPDEEVFAKLPQWLMDKINAAIDEDAPKRAPMGTNNGAPKAETKPAKQEAWASPPPREQGDPGPFVDDVELGF